MINYDNETPSDYVRKNIGLYPDDAKYLEQNKLSPTEIVRNYIKEHRDGKKKSNLDQKIEVVRTRVVVVFIGIILLSIAGFRSIGGIYSVLFYVAGLLFIFYGVFDMAIKVMKMIVKKGGKV